VSFPGRPGIRLVAVHAHPDDETLATGLALAQHRVWGDEVHVVTATLGEEGEVIPPELAHLEGDEALTVVRRAELAAAMQTLGVQHHFLGGDPPPWRDSGMAGSAAARHPRAFVGAHPEQPAQALADQIRHIAPDVVLTYDPQGGYAHPDHIQTHRVVVSALAMLPEESRPAGFMVLTPRSWAVADRDWLRGHGALDPALSIPDQHEAFPPSVVPDEVVTHVLDPADSGGDGDEAVEVLALRDAALRHHRTQVTVYDGYYALSNEIAARLPRREGYARLPQLG
jgi:N-acetyl-1-D-myo-inositol-2-amino-2-deoxy-alpha-D-glucopyranoside deacetylase